jgi:predicted small metal-binding protein
MEYAARSRGVHVIEEHRSDQQEVKMAMAADQKTIVCRDSGANCDYEVRDTDENEVLASAQTHAKRKHGQDMSFDDLRPMVRDVRASERGQ